MIKKFVWCAPETKKDLITSSTRWIGSRLLSSVTHHFHPSKFVILLILKFNFKLLLVVCIFYFGKTTQTTNLSHNFRYTAHHSFLKADGKIFQETKGDVFADLSLVNVMFSIAIILYFSKNTLGCKLLLNTLHLGTSTMSSLFYIYRVCSIFLVD